MAEATTKLKADEHVVLDQPLLRLPLELQRRNFKQSQIKIDHEQKKTTELLRNAAKSANSASPDDTTKALDGMIQRMENLKRDLETLHEEEQSLNEQSSKRIRHLQELYEIPSLTDVKYENWSRTRLDRLVVDYLLRAGYSDTAAALAESKDIQDLIDLDTFKQCHKIADSIQGGSTTEALRWVVRNKDSLKKLLEKTPDKAMITPAVTPKVSQLEFELRFQEYIELLRRHPTRDSARYEAIMHAQKHLAPHSAAFPVQYRITAGLLAVDPTDPSESYQEYFSPSRWTYLSQLFVDSHHQIFNLPTQPLLHVALSAGLSALKTPACHSSLNPSSAATDGHEHAKPMFTPTPFSNHIGNSLCPICSTELNELAKNVPYAHHTKSSVENDPVMLPNGRVYGRERLEELEVKNLRMTGTRRDADEERGKDNTKGRTVVDPVTGDTYPWSVLKKVYIT
ncbi:GID complex subunit containing RING finger motif [Knufia obscura]|uniref:Protein FYV10 n=2 Tax=Knufia TaxID=430999 RepID=A0AAN8F3Q9_9EURO|nr:GID complex subunit containing RING finger motif [Knufia obscura]KAK5950636.1 GID complex subunit containing RING finger motif [Knufia fluminis]